MYFLTHTLILSVRDLHGDMTVTFNNPCRTTFGPCPETLECRGLVDEDQVHFQFIDISAVIVLGIGNRPTQALS